MGVEELTTALVDLQEESAAAVPYGGSITQCGYVQRLGKILQDHSNPRGDAACDLWFRVESFMIMLADPGYEQINHPAYMIAFAERFPELKRRRAA